MIDQELENIVRTLREKRLHDAYTRNALKEYLQVSVLYFLYTSPTYRQKLIFTGGTCLRHFYGLERLSEDIDFDCIDALPSRKLLGDLERFFHSKYHYRDLQTALKQNGNQILLKFPVLKKLGLASENESDFLYIRLDLAILPSENYSILTTSKSSFGINYAAKHYDLSSLMAGKLHAILKRTYLKGKENRSVIKGRDYFDLLWFVKQGVCPNIQRLADMLGENINWQALEAQVDEKVAMFVSKHKSEYRADMTPLIQNPDILEIYIDNYEQEYRRFKTQSFCQKSSRP